MSLRRATVNENARSALDCGGLTPPWNQDEGQNQEGVKGVEYREAATPGFLPVGKGRSIC